MPLVTELPPDLRRVHIMGVGGTAMAALAGMLVDAGYAVTGSDGGVVYPPMSDYLARLKISPMVGFAAENLDAAAPDLVVVGNVVRASYPEAEALLASDLPYMSFPGLLGAMFLADKQSIVVAGTHGKTTTTAIAAWLLEAAGKQPGFLIGGVAANFDRTARVAQGRQFVIEGDEYDTAFFDKGPKFLHYRPHIAILTSLELDHIDIYDSLEDYRRSFQRLMALLPPDGCVVARWDHDSVASVAREARCPLRRYGPGQDWDGRIESIDTQTGTMTFTVLHAGKAHGTYTSGMVGDHNLYNQVAVVAALDRAGLKADALTEGFRTFRGIKRRQEIIGEEGSVTVIDDFAHHPTAVRVTLQALRQRFGGRRLWAIFEPRSSTSRHAIFQEQFAEAFDEADLTVIAPPHDQSRILPEERLSAPRLVAQLRARGNEAFLWGERPEGVEDWSAERSARVISAQIAANAQPEDVIAILSNGGFGGLHRTLLAELRQRFIL